MGTIWAHLPAHKEHHAGQKHISPQLKMRAICPVQIALLVERAKGLWPWR
jgi:hypothetical protein